MIGQVKVISIKSSAMVITVTVSSSTSARNEERALMGEGLLVVVGAEVGFLVLVGEEVVGEEVGAADVGDEVLVLIKSLWSISSKSRA